MLKRMLLLLVSMMLCAGSSYAQLKIKNSVQADIFQINQDGNAGIGIAPSSSFKLYVSGTTRLNGLNINGAYSMPTSAGTTSQFLRGDGVWGAPSISETDPQVGANTASYVPRWNGSALVTGRIRDDGSWVAINDTPSDAAHFRVLGNTNNADAIYGTANNGGAGIHGHGYVAMIPSVGVHASGDIGAGSLYVSGGGDARFVNTSGITGVTGIIYFGQDANVNMNRQSNRFLIGSLPANGTVEIVANTLISLDAPNIQLKQLPSTAASPNLYVTGDRVYLSSSSSVRFKENIRPLEGNAMDLLAVEPKSFTYKESKQEGIGFIAEELDAAGFKSLVNYGEDGLPEGVNYDKVSLYLLQVIKEQQKRIEQLEAHLK